MPPFPLAYAAGRLGWWAERLAPADRVELAAFVPGLWRGLVLCGGAPGLAALAFLIAGQPLAIAVVGGAAFVSLTLLLLRDR